MREYVCKTADEIRNIALGVQEGTIFGSWMLKPEDDKELRCAVFVSLGMLDEIAMKKMQRDDIIHVYGDITENVTPTALPLIFGFKTLDAADFARFQTAAKALADYYERDF